MERPLKPAKTYEEMVDLMIARGIQVNNKDAVCSILGYLNYYRLSAYMLPYKSASGEYIKTDFTKILAIYQFDQELRSCLFRLVEQIEVTIRTRLAYYHGHTYGPAGYMDSRNFTDMVSYNNMITSYRREVEQCKNLLFVKHHKKYYGGEMPVWVAVEILTMTAISNFYAGMSTHDQKAVAEKYGIGCDYLRSWLICICELRNRCAHYMRLYYHNFLNTPSAPKNAVHFDPTNRRLFNILIAGKCLVGGRADFWPSWKLQLENVIAKYMEHIELDHIGFPENWNDIL